jgi:hypothetical protein
MISRNNIGKYNAFLSRGSMAAAASAVSLKKKWRRISGQQAAAAWRHQAAARSGVVKA